MGIRTGRTPSSKRMMGNDDSIGNEQSPFPFYFILFLISTMPFTLSRQNIRTSLLSLIPKPPPYSLLVLITYDSSSPPVFPRSTAPSPRPETDAKWQPMEMTSTSSSPSETSECWRPHPPPPRPVLLLLLLLIPQVAPPPRLPPFRFFLLILKLLIWFFTFKATLRMTGPREVLGRPTCRCSAMLSRITWMIIR